MVAAPRAHAFALAFVAVFIFVYALVYDGGEIAPPPRAVQPPPPHAVPPPRHAAPPSPPLSANHSRIPPAPRVEPRLAPLANLTARQGQVRHALADAWGAYRIHAWGSDELRPVSHAGADDFGSLSVTLVDSLDSLWLMGLRAEFVEAVDYVARTCLGLGCVLSLIHI